MVTFLNDPSSEKKKKNHGQQEINGLMYLKRQALNKRTVSSLSFPLHFLKLISHF